MRQPLITEHFAQSKIENEQLSSKSKHIESSKRPNSISTECLQKSHNFQDLFEKPQRFSQKTLKLIQYLDLPAFSPLSTHTDSILNAVPMREKYEDLLKTSKLSLTLPYKYKRLLKISKLIDHTINNSRLYHIPISFCHLQQAIWLSHNQRVEIEQVQKINNVIPKFYVIYWKSDSLFLDIQECGFLPKSVLHSRHSNLKQELISRVKYFHSIHLSNNSLSFDADARKTWHSTFNLHNIPDLHPSPLPERAQPESKGKIELIKQRRALRLIILCKLLIKIFNNSQTPSLFMKSLIKLIQKEKESSEETKDIEYDLTEIQEIFGFWINIIDTESGKVVRVNKQSEFCFQSAWSKIEMKYKS